MSQSKKLFSTSGVSQTGQGQSSPVGEGGNNTGLFNVSTYQYGKTGNYGQTRDYHVLDQGEVDTGIDLTGTPSTDIDDYYSVDMWTGQLPYGQEIVNGIDMINNKTMTFIKGHSYIKDSSGYNRLDYESSPMFLDSERGNSKVFFSNRGPAGSYRSETTLGGNSNFFQYTTGGYKWGYGSSQTALCLNTIGQRYLGYTFRAKPKFFDVVKYTGDGTLDRQISHNLQTEPRFMIIKCLSDNMDSLFVMNQSPSSAYSLKYKLYPEMEGSHTTYGQTGLWYSGQTGDPGNVGAQTANFGGYSNQTFWAKYNLGDGTNVIMPTTSNFTVGHVHNATTVSGFTNRNGKEYVAYLWASDDSSSSMIKCGTFGNTNFNVNLGWRPQTILIFPYSGISGTTTGGFATADLLIDKKLYMGSSSYAGDVLIRRPWSFWSNTSHSATMTQAGYTSYHSAGTSGTTHMSVNSQGFKGDGGGATNQLFSSSLSYFYIAIRDSEYTWSNTSANKGFYFWGNTKRHKSIDTTPDYSNRLDYSDNQVIDTVRANDQQTGSVGSNSSHQPDQLERAYGSFQGYYASNGHFQYSGMRYFDRTKLGIHPVTPVTTDSGKYFVWGMKAYPKFFDIVEWTGDGTTNRQISHNLQSTPAMIILSEVTSTDRYPRVWHKDLPNSMGFLDTKDQFQPNTYNNWGNFHDTAHPYKVFGGTGGATGVATPTSTYFTVSHAEGVSGGYPDNNSPPNYNTKRAGNNTGVKYYAYLFADQKTTGNIAVGSYTGNGWSTAQTGSIYHERPASNLAAAYGPSIYDSGVFVDLGWEPQWIMVKNMNRAQTSWTMFDTTRGWDWNMGESYDATSQYGDNSPHNMGQHPIHNRGQFHVSADVGHPMTKGFEVRGAGNGNGTTTSPSAPGIYSGVGSGSSAIGTANSWNWNIAGDTYLYVAIRRDEISPTEGKQIYAISRGKNLINGHGDQFSFGSSIYGLSHTGSHALAPISSTSTYNDHQNPVLFKPDLVIVNDGNSNSSSYNMMRIMTRGWGTYAPSLTNNTHNDTRITADLWPQTTANSANPFSMSSGFGLSYPYPQGTWNNGSSAQDSKIYTHMLKRAKGFMDIIHYRGSGTSMTKPHALGVAPEMLIFNMARFDTYTSSSYDSLNSGWHIYHKDMTPSGSGDWTTMKMMFGLGTGSWTTDSSGFGTYRADDSMTNTSTPNYVGDGTIGVGSTDDASGSHSAQASLSVTATDITIGGAQAVNNGGSDPYYHQCIMFATLPGVSKVGYYLGTGTSTVTVNCGFSSSARFILIKREDDKGPWVVIEGGDGHHGGYQSNIRVGSDQLTFLNRKDAIPGRDFVEPYANGFLVMANSYTNGSIQSQPNMGGVPININGARYIFLAIA